MAMITRAATLRMATMLPQATSEVDQQICNGEFSLKGSSDVPADVVVEGSSTLCVTDQKPMSNVNDSTLCITEDESIHNMDESTLCDTEQAPMSNAGDCAMCVTEQVPMNNGGDCTLCFSEQEPISNVINHTVCNAEQEPMSDVGDSTYDMAPNTTASVNGQLPGNINVFGYSNYVTTAIPGVDTVGMNTVPQAFHSLYVQYTSGAVPQAVYPSNDHMSYPMYVVGRTGAICAPPQNPFFLDNSSSTVCNAVANIPPPDPEPRQPWTFDTGTIPVQEDLDPDPDPDPDPDQDAEDIITAQRLGRQSTVQWLLQNYETAEGESLRRSTLYNHYLRHCREQNIDSVNAASFGKLIRSVFLGLRTRRLGTRGNSKYHYYGIRIKPGSRLNYVTDHEVPTPVQQPVPTQQTKPASQECCNFLSRLEQCNIDNSTEEHVDSSVPTPLRYPIHHEDLSSHSDALPEFPCIDWPQDCAIPMCCSVEDIELLSGVYRKHCEELRDAAVHLDFRTTEGIWREFWQIRDNINAKCGNGKRLSAIKIYVLSTCVPIQQYVRHVDYHFYQHLVDIIVPDVLRPMPRSLIRSIRNFADGLPSLLKAILVAWPSELIQIKVSAVKAFARSLYLYTSLNHIAQSVRTTIEDQSNLQQMMNDLSKVDFRDIHERAFWVCHGENETLQQFDIALQHQPPSSLDECITNLTEFVTRMLKPYEGNSDFEKVARQFLLQWSYYSSLFMGYLTLRNATSFGSFHLVRLFSDEYVFYLVVHKVAQETGETAVAVIGEKYDKVLSSLNGHSSLNDALDHTRIKI